MDLRNGSAIGSEDPMKNEEEMKEEEQWKKEESVGCDTNASFAVATIALGFWAVFTGFQTNAIAR